MDIDGDRGGEPESGDAGVQYGGLADVGTELFRTTISPMSDIPKQAKYTQAELDEKVRQMLQGQQLHQLIAKDLGMENRMNVLLASLFVEDLLGIFVEKLELKGEKKGFMSFDAKINKLRGVVINEEERILLDTFRWTRNRFIHDLVVTSFTKRYEDETDYKRRILNFAQLEIEKAPDEMTWSEEQKLLMGFNLLFQRVSKITGRITDELLPPPTISAPSDGIS